ncbi:MAG: hypothetical protein ACI9XP_001447 [Lentimonas sp.]|jgi:hypothetical protein
MKEHYLHFLWKMKFIPSRDLKTSLDSTISILDFGHYNSTKGGPDFYSSTLKIDNIQWIGDVEFHIKSSDWYKHKHHKDPAYNNVILHVVWEHDKEVIVLGHPLPTLVIKDYVASDFYSSFLKTNLYKTRFPCSFALPAIRQGTIEKSKQTMVIEKLKSKLDKLTYSSKSASQALYQLIAQAFGQNTNQEGFVFLAQSLPIKLMDRKQFNTESVFTHISGLQLDSSDVLSINELSKLNLLGLTQLDPWIWKKKGLRPKGFPEIRIKQFAIFVDRFDFYKDWTKTNPKGFLLKMETFRIECNQFLEANPISRSFMNGVLINAFAPFFYKLYLQTKSTKMIEMSFELLKGMSPEQNTKIKHMTLQGFCVESAYDTQAFIQLERSLCSQKKCLSCNIGKEVLKT